MKDRRPGDSENRRHDGNSRRPAGPPNRRPGGSWRPSGPPRRSGPPQRSGPPHPPEQHRPLVPPQPPSSDILYGRRSVLEALKAKGRSIHKIWIAENTHGTEEIIKMAHEQGVPIDRAQRRDLDFKAGGGHHQGIVAQASATVYLELEDFLKQLGTAGAVIVALDEIQDPHNIGAVLRSAAFFGAAGAIVPRWRSAPVGETAARVSSGGIEHVPLMRVRNLADAVLTLQQAGFEVIGADLSGEDFKSYTPGKRTALIFGNEGDGIRRLVKERCDKLLKISGAGKVDSLNVSASAAIFFQHFCKNA